MPSPEPDVGRPEISICIPTFNGSMFLKQALTPLLDSDPERVEIVVSDHGSTDGTRAVIHDAVGSRVRLLPGALSREDGAGANWMRAVNAARGRFVKILCQDDVVTTALIYEQADRLQRNPSAAFCFSPVDVISSSGRALLRRRRLGRDLSGETDLVMALARYGTNPIGEPVGVMFRREAIPAELELTEHFMLDLELYLEGLKYGPAVFLDAPGAGFRVSGSSWSRSLERHQVLEAQSMINRRLISQGMPPLSLVGRLRIRVGAFARRLLSWVGARC